MQENHSTETQSDPKTQTFIFSEFLQKFLLNLTDRVAFLLTAEKELKVFFLQKFQNCNHSNSGAMCLISS